MAEWDPDYSQQAADQGIPAAEKGAQAAGQEVQAAGSGQSLSLGAQLGVLGLCQALDSVPAHLLCFCQDHLYGNCPLEGELGTLPACQAHMTLSHTTLCAVAEIMAMAVAYCKVSWVKWVLEKQLSVRRQIKEPEATK